MSIDNAATIGTMGRRIYGGYNISAPGANTAIITAFTPSLGCTALRVCVALTTGSVFNVTATNGTTGHKWGLNESTALNAADLYAFGFPVMGEDQSGNAMSYSFEVETDGVIETLTVDEVMGGHL